MNTSSFSGSIPELYDAHLGPLLFEFAARDLAARVKEKLPAPERILEIACGTGIVTARLRETFPEAKITASDLNEAMIDVAKKKPALQSGIQFEVADALDLQFSEAEFDAVVCQFGIMFFPDKEKGLAEMKRVLKPGGLLAFNVWGGMDDNPSVKLTHETISGFFENDPPQFLKVPFGLADVDRVMGLLSTAGFEDGEHHVVSATVEGKDASSIAKGFVEGNPGIFEIRERATAPAEEITRKVAEVLKARFGPEPLQIPLQEIVFLAKKPE